jgi:hypothetical protein
VIFFNPAGAPELACDECGCRWFDRLRNRCYECGAEVSPEAMQAFEQALQTWGQSKLDPVKSTGCHPPGSE